MNMNIENIYKKIIDKMEDFICDNNIKKFIIGLSGGIDSALVLALAVKVIGKDNVIPIYMPSCYSSELSRKLAYQVANNFELNLIEECISDINNSYINNCKCFKEYNNNIAKENLQARIRANILMTYSNIFNNSIVLCTGNLTEVLMGYYTIYGDAIGGLAPIGNLLKKDVIKLSRYINEIEKQEKIPEEIINSVPTAELREGQTDEEEFGISYEKLDIILEQILNNTKVTDINEEYIKIKKRIESKKYKYLFLPPSIKI